jgi:hypothetical protein
MSNSTITLAKSAGRVLPDLASAQAAEIAELRAMVESLKANARQPGRVSFKVSEKGCVSIYGMNMRGIHLYASQWLKILDHAEAIRQFIEANRAKLAWKGEA